MDAWAWPVLERLPLAEAVLLAWSHVAEEGYLRELFDQHRGACYEKQLSFPVLVQLIGDVLMGQSPSARRRFTDAVAAAELPASSPAAYGKLRRLPVPLSVAFLAGCTARLQALWPAASAVTLPPCVRDWSVLVLDGKAIKRVAKRLKPLRGAPGGVLGGRALVALTLRQGLALALEADPDGETNDVRLVPSLLPAVRGRTPGPRLWVADRQFCAPQVLTDLLAEGDHVLVRYHGNVCFTRDPTRPVGTGQDADGRTWREEWGWLGGVQNPQRRFVRRITLERPGQEAIIPVTDLLDAQRFPATALLELYRQRWGIERMFQQVTAVFGLEALIGSTPEATIFQFSFCLVLYNVIQVVRAYVAGAGHRPAAEVSGEQLFQDVTKQLIAWRELLTPAD